MSLSFSTEPVQPSLPVSPLEQSDESALAKPLLGQSLADLTTWVQQQGQPAYRGKQLHQWIYQQGVRHLSDISCRGQCYPVEISRR
ncbi:hypothetical protein [Leptolyngbya sp. 7M]|uniref:hypothetical protein n=1 Tax=Leptolyngbya sp. 7M TaxID=2812896 RepID=UPI002939523B|nr:hypothetical protein [Leptolyngbya sp. 7M]